MTRPLPMKPAQPPRRPTVSDHAVLRWLERYLEIDIEAVRASILTPERVAAIRCGAVHIRCPAEGVILCISQDGTVKTVLPIKERKR